MNNLLIGSGFSRNWGGLISNEVFEHLLGNQTVANDQDLKEILWKHKDKAGFEQALSYVQILYARNPEKYGEMLRNLQNAILKIFVDMNEAFFELADMEFTQHLDGMLRTFLFQFDAIFTLNQDVFLEHHYFKHVELSEKWHGIQMPGMTRIQNQDELINPSWGKDNWAPADQNHFKVEPGKQPFFKLHGSSNWRTGDGDNLLVIGDNKNQAINLHPVLGWQFEQFKARIGVQNARLLIIGYGFKDEHINKVIVEAVENSGLKLFVIDPLGSDICKHANPSYGGQIYAKNALDYAFEKGLVGATRRQLKEIFGSDAVAHNLVMRFFES